MNNLPPGCNSDDGGIDHSYEEAMENLDMLNLDAEILTMLVRIAPHIKMIYMSGYQQGMNEAKLESSRESDKTFTEYF